MNHKGNYYKISRNGNVHTLSDRLPFNWKELFNWTAASSVFLIWFLGIGLGIFVTALTSIGFISYRFTAWIYYSELKIDEKTGEVTYLRKILEHTQKTELLTNKFDSKRLQFSELTRSGKTKFLMNYRTHKNNELLILNSKKDKEFIERYIAQINVI
ncbi:hypothetical protein [Dokdonia donghaensis]|uniref:hypothetical protein n=1 Tax=Dokdonia donghaensis TaxID=326320 RepID=UPI0035C7C1C9